MRELYIYRTIGGFDEGDDMKRLASVLAWTMQMAVCAESAKMVNMFTAKIARF